MSEQSEPNISTLSLTKDEMLMLETLFTLGAARIVQMAGRRVDSSTEFRLLWSYLRIEEHLHAEGVDRLNKKISAAADIARNAPPVGSALPVILRHDLTEKEAILLVNILSLANALLHVDANSASTVFAHVKGLVDSDPDIYNSMMHRLIATTAAALPDVDFVSL